MAIIQDSHGKSIIPVLTLPEYFGQEFSLHIPPWQREYTWLAEEDGQTGDLLDDFYKFVKDESATEYLLGATILCEVKGNTKSRFVIDGQQRSVTLTIFFMCCMKYLSDTKSLSAKDHLFVTKLLRTYDSGDYNFEPQLQFEQQNANIIIKIIRDWVNSPTQDEKASVITEQETYSQTQKNLLAAAQFIYKYIKDGKWLAKDELIPGIEKILKGVKLLQITLDNQKEAIQVFDRINNRGMRLNDAELLKNILFQNVSDEKFDAISENWNEMSLQLRSIKSSKLQDPKYLLRAYAWTKYPVKTTYDGLTDLFIEKNEVTNENAALEFSNQLFELSKGLTKLSTCQWIETADNAVFSHLYPGQFLGSVQHYPVLLAGLKLKDKKAISRLCYLVGARTTLYVLAKERPPEFETVVLKWANAVNALPENADVEAINGTFVEGIAPTDQMILQMQANIRSWNYAKSSDKKRIRATLAYMSWWLDELAGNHNAGIDSYFQTRKPRGQKGWDLEHVDAIKSGSHLDLSVKNTIGNLVLLHPGDNVRLKDKPANVKNVGYSQSKIILTKSASDTALAPEASQALSKLYENLGVEVGWHLDSWDKSEVKNRSDFYVSFITAMLTDQLPLPKTN